jgi:3-hydroxyacyl-[acyl-carrier-protein] dehydratase
VKRLGELEIRIVVSTPASVAATVLLHPDFAGFAGHFPGDPVLPGMCHVDLAVRAASQAIGAPLHLVAVDRARFVRRALPGDELKIRLVLRRSAGDVTAVEAAHSVGGEPVAELRLGVTRRATPR